MISNCILKRDLGVERCAMLSRLSCQVVLASFLVGIPSVFGREDPDLPSPSSTQEPAVETKASRAAQPPAKSSSPAEQQAGVDPKNAAPTPAAPAPNDAAAARALAKERLKTLTQPAEKADTAQNKGLREVLEERLRKLDEWDAASKARDEAEHPAQLPEHQASELKAKLERVRASLDRSAKNSTILLPDTFRGRIDKISTDTLSEMKQAIETAKEELQKATADLDDFRSNPERNASNALADLRAERDRMHQKCTTFETLRAEREAAVTKADSAEAREMASERLINFDWESRVETERLRTKEAEIELRTKLSALDEPELQLREARRELAKRALDAIQSRFQQVVDRQQTELKQAVAHEQVRAEAASDPLERYRAFRNAELLELKALALKDEQTLSISPAMSLETQTELADRAERDFASLQQFVKESRSSALVALRLKNDYRRVWIERSQVARNELDRATNEITRWDNALTAVELDIVSDSRDERYVLDRLLDALPLARRPDALALAAAVDAERRIYLERRRTTLQKIVERAQGIHNQVQRRIQILDDQYAYVRTHILWMPDTEPIGRATLSAIPREFRRLARSVIRIAWEATDRSNWGQVTPEFALLLLLALVLLWPLHRARLLLNTWLESERRAQPHRAA